MEDNLNGFAAPPGRSNPPYPLLLEQDISHSIPFPHPV